MLPPSQDAPGTITAAVLPNEKRMRVSTVVVDIDLARLPGRWPLLRPHLLRPSLAHLLLHLAPGKDRKGNPTLISESTDEERKGKTQLELRNEEVSQDLAATLK